MIASPGFRTTVVQSADPYPAAIRKESTTSPIAFTNSKNSHHPLLRRSQPLNNVFQSWKTNTHSLLPSMQRFAGLKRVSDPLTTSSNASTTTESTPPPTKCIYHLYHPLPYQTFPPSSTMPLIISTSPLYHYIPSLSHNSITTLSSPISTQETLNTINSKEPDSSPGPDGLTYNFYKLFPTPTSLILTRIFNLIANGSPPPHSWSKTSTILLHKKNSDPLYIQNHHPITLSNTDLKILSTILAARSQTHASYLISPDQTGFMQGRHITDTILDINALLTLPDPPPNAFLLSIDWSKAYDRVSHYWLDHILNKALFPLSFQRLVHTTYHHRYTSITINGHPGPLFRVSRGVPQGDPFAPFLFNLSIEPLFNALRSATIMFRAYADDIYLYGHDNSSWDPIAFWFHQYYLTINR